MPEGRIKKQKQKTKHSSSYYKMNKQNILLERMCKVTEALTEFALCECQTLWGPEAQWSINSISTLALGDEWADLGKLMLKSFDKSFSATLFTAKRTSFTLSDGNRVCANCPSGVTFPLNDSRNFKPHQLPQQELNISWNSLHVCCLLHCLWYLLNIMCTWEYWVKC